MKFYPPIHGTNEVGVVDFRFSFLTNGASAVDQTSIRGQKVASVTRTGTGTYDVTLDGPYYQIVTAHAELFDDVSGTGGGTSVYFADEAAGPLVIKVYTRNAAGSLADLTARRVCVALFLKASRGA